MAGPTCTEVETFYYLVVGAMVFLMQMGFAMLEYSAVHPHHGSSVLLKNLMDACIAAISWWLLGFGLVNGIDDGSGFVGTASSNNETDTKPFFYSVGEKEVGGVLTGQFGYASWFYGFAFAATAATIVSGAVAERTQFTAYFAYSLFLTAIVYPIVAHWIWTGDGWLAKKGLIDFAGSGVVHMTGGVAALWGAIVVGPRKFMMTQNGSKPRFEEGKVYDHKFLKRGLPFGVLGTIVLWFGWYAFNGGSVLGICEGEDTGKKADIMGTAIATTTIAPASAAITGAFVQMIFNKVNKIKDGPDPAFICNCILAGLVGITAGASTVENWAAVIIGCISTFVYMGASKLLKILKIDDVIDAFPVHGACGAWGLISTGLFASNRLVKAAQLSKAGLFYDGSDLIGWEFVAVLAIFGWVTLCMAPLFLGLRFTNLLRLDETLERCGHGASEKENDHDVEMTNQAEKEQEGVSLSK